MMISPANKNAEIHRKLDDIERLEAVFKQVSRQAIEEDLRAGNKIPVWRDGQVVWETPDLSEFDSTEG